MLRFVIVSLFYGFSGEEGMAACGCTDMRLGPDPKP